MVAEAGLDLHFLPAGKKIMVLPPSSWRQATLHRSVAFRWVLALLFAKREKKKAIPIGMTFPFLVAEAGLEPTTSGL